MIILIKLHLAKINKNMFMRLMVVIQLQSCKSELIIINKESQDIVYPKSNLFVKVAKLQKISKNAKFLLVFFENRLKKSSWVVQKIFSYKNLRRVMTKYDEVINNIKLIEKLDVELYDILSDPCFLFMVYSNLRKDIVDKFNGVGRARTFESEQR
jgi:hypothetical protein